MTENHNNADKIPAFFGCPLDSDEKQDSITEKLETIGREHIIVDPYEAIMELIRQDMVEDLYTEKGSLTVPDWLLPIPPAKDRALINTEQFVKFIDRDGCRRQAELAGRFAVEQIHPNIPCLIGVDHSLTGGILQSLAGIYDPGDITLIVLDSHLDAMTMPLLAGAIEYDLENNPDSLYDADDPYLKSRPDSFNASSFLHFLLEEETIYPENLYVLGISDYPPKHAFRIKDPRIKAYTQAYSGLKAEGARILTKKDLTASPEKLKRLLGRIDTPYVYISIDLDIGSNNAVGGVRFRDWTGLSEIQLNNLARLLHQTITRGPRLIGLDVTEINPRLAYDDDTYYVAATLIEIILFGIH